VPRGGPLFSKRDGVQFPLPCGVSPAVAQGEVTAAALTVCMQTRSQLELARRATYFLCREKEGRLAMDGRRGAYACARDAFSVLPYRVLQVRR
jgi:hypothetical protein